MIVYIQVEPGQAGWRQFREREKPWKAYIKKRESLQERPLTAWLVRPSTAWSLGSLGPWHFLLSKSLSDAATVSWSGLRLSIFEILTDLSIWATMRQVRATCRQIKCKKGRDFFDTTNTHGFVPLLPSKHHLYKAMPMRSASTAHYTTIRRPTQQSLRDPAYAAQTMTVSCDFYLPSTATKRQSSHSDAKCTPGSPNTMAQRAESCKDHLRTALTMGHFCAIRAQTEREPQTRFPLSTPGATLCEKTQDFVRFHAISNVQTSPWPSNPNWSAITALQITMELRRPRLQTSHSSHSIANITTLFTPLLATSLLSPHLYSLHISDDVLLWWGIVVIMYCCDYVLLWWCIVVIMYCCNYVLLWLCIVVMMYCCDDVLLWLCIVVVRYCCPHFQNFVTRSLDY